MHLFKKKPKLRITVDWLYYYIYVKDVNFLLRVFLDYYRKEC